MENSVDNSNEIGYNVPKDDTNVEVVDMAQVAPINDTNHEHQLVADPEDTLGEAIYHGCVLPKCGVGFYIQPTKK